MAPQAETRQAPAVDMYFGDAKSARRLTEVIAIADSHSARIIGVAGVMDGVGASTAARQLAGAYASVGRKVLLADASQARTAKLGEVPSEIPIDILSMSREVRPALSLTDLSARPETPPLSQSTLRSAFEQANRMGYTVIVDLPAVGQATDEPPAIATSGPACDLVYLVCVSGRTKRRDMTTCVQTCGIIGIRIAGVILNDWQLPANFLLES